MRALPGKLECGRDSITLRTNAINAGVWAVPILTGSTSVPPESVLDNGVRLIRPAIATKGFRQRTAQR